MLVGGDAAEGMDLAGGGSAEGRKGAKLKYNGCWLKYGQLLTEFLRFL
jgi:hypothetical protein